MHNAVDLIALTMLFKRMAVRETEDSKLLTDRFKTITLVTKFKLVLARTAKAAALRISPSIAVEKIICNTWSGFNVDRMYCVFGIVVLFEFAIEIFIVKKKTLSL